jgi:hypothetical protein
VVYELACLPLVPEFAVSNPAEAVGFFLLKKSSACLPSEGKSNNLSHVPTLGHVKDPISCSSLRADGKIRMYSFLPSVIEASRAAWCGAPLEMKEGIIWIWGTEGLSIRPRCSNPNDNFTFTLGIQHAMLTRYIFICGLIRSTLFFHIISQEAQFSKKKKILRKRKWVFCFSLQPSTKTFLIP